MRGIDFQDSVYRTQATEKLQARLQNDALDAARLTQLKREEVNEVKQNLVNESEEMREKRVEREKEEKKRQEREQKEKEKAKEEEKEKEKKTGKKPGSDGHIIDLEA